MINKLRDKKVAKRIWIVLAIMIMPAFLLWGIGSAVHRSSKGGPEYAGKIFGKKISFSDFRQAYLAVRNQYILRLGEEFSKLEKYLNLTARTWERLILLYEAGKKKIKVSDREVTEFIQTLPSFQSAGKFDYQTYARIIEFYFNAQPRIFEEQTRENLILAKLYENATANVKVTPEEVRDEYKKENEQVSIYYINAAIADFAAEVNIDEAQLNGYFITSALEFKKPQTFNLEYASLDYPADSKDADTKAIDDKAKEIVSRLNKEKDLVKIAREFSLEIKQSGFFSINEPIPGIGWSSQIIDSILALKVGEIAPAIQTPKGWFILKLKEKKESYVPTLDEVKTQVKEKLTQIKSKEIARKKIESAQEELKKSSQGAFKDTNLEKIAKALNLKSAATELFKRSGYIQGIGASERFFDEAQKLDKESISQIIETEQGYYIIKVKEIVPIDEEKFKKEEKEFSEALLSRKKEDYFAKFLEDLKRKARLQDNMASLVSSPQ